MLAAVCSLLSLCLIMGGQGVQSAPATQQEWQERYLDRELTAELYNLLQNYLMEGGPMVPVQRPAIKRNSEIINSLLALPKGMADVGRR